jgi:hypothetical protein
MKILIQNEFDETRIIKWMNNQFDSNKWNIINREQGIEIKLEITIDKLSKTEQENLFGYLKSQSYIYINKK